ncbi:MAG: DegT/DnrJ/EryC1/StrS family aminotransferase [Fimbriimonadaceae bacterium]|nr:DegT/DnrJ/EryC1/StrS family aminotransferase [Chitinophagales bacterium]
MCGKELEYVQDAFASNWIAPLGSYVNRFEKDICSYVGIQHAAALSSGTAAMHLALKIRGVKKGDYVICPSFTFSASANPVIYENAIPVFVDSETNTWNMDANLLAEAIEFCIQKKNKKPAAIIVVHLYGMPANMHDIIIVSNKYEIPIIEDAAESLGSKYKDQYTGTFGVLNILSFNGNKIITTSGGGALISNNKDYIETAKFLATQARDKAPHYEHSQIGYNYRLSNICAAIGVGQMTVLEERIQQRRNNFNTYSSALNDLNGISFLKEKTGYFSNRWLTTILIDETKTNGISNTDIRLQLEQQNIEARPLWKPLHLQPVFKHHPKFVNGTSEKLFNSGLCLPSGSDLSQQNLTHIIAVIKSGLEPSKSLK